MLYSADRNSGRDGRKVAPPAQLHPQVSSKNYEVSPDRNEQGLEDSQRLQNKRDSQGFGDNDAREAHDRASNLPRDLLSRASSIESGISNLNLAQNNRHKPSKRSSFDIGASDASNSTEPNGHSRTRNNRKGSVSRRYKRTACFVHSLLEVQQRNEADQRRQSASPLNSQSTPASRPDSPSHEERQDKRDLFTHLSKKEISDMALGVRELSKHLGSARLKLNIHHILVVTKTGDKSLIEKTRQVCEWLLYRSKSESQRGHNLEQNNYQGKRSGYTVYVEEPFRQEKGFDTLQRYDAERPGRLKFWTAELCTKSPHLFDFVLTLGGDGTVLYTSWLFQRIVPPVLSFALGSLGFLTMFNFDEHRENITSVFNEGVTAALRMRIECTVYRASRRSNGELVTDSEQNDLMDDIINSDHLGEDHHRTHTADMSFSVLNDLVVDRGPNPFMSSTELFGDDEHLTSIAADGVCISTPTGSTAYSLAAGGSLCHPEIPAILISPICPHTLSFRPLLVPDSMVLRVAVPYESRSTAWASFDGRNRVELNQGDYVRISASRFPFPTCLKSKQTGDWFESISRTLNWNERKKQKGC